MSLHRLKGLFAACWIGCTFGIQNAESAASGNPAVLFLEEDEPGRPAYVEVMHGFRQALKRNLPGMVVVYQENLDLARFPSPDYREQSGQWLRQKYRDVEIDVVVAAGPVSMELARQFRKEYWPHAKIIGVSGNGSPDNPDDTVARLTVGLDVAGTIDVAKTLMPEASRLVVVMGASVAYEELGAWVLGEAEEAATRHGLTMETLTGLSFEETRHRLSLLPRDVIVFYDSFYIDGAGQSHIPRDALVHLSRTSGAPVFGMMGTFIGHGLTGGSVLSMEVLGSELGEMTAEAISAPAGEAPASRVSRANRIMFDWRELQKFGLAGRPLPDGAEIHFEPPSLWETHREVVLVTGIFLVAQSAWIVALIIQLRLRRRAEQKVSNQRDQLAHAGRVSSLGQLVASIAHELNQPLGAILNNARAAERLLQNENPDIVELRAIIADIRADDTRASDSIEQMRAMLNRSPMAFAAVALKNLLHQTATLLMFDANRRGVDLKVVTDLALPPVHGDPTCLQQIVINLVLNSMDALDGKDDGSVVIKADPDAFGSMIILRVQDNGQGIPEAVRASIFEPFHTTKPAGMGMGLAICQTIAEAHGGTLELESSGPEGTCFSCSLHPAPSPTSAPA